MTLLPLPDDRRGGVSLSVMEVSGRLGDALYRSCRVCVVLYRHRTAEDSRLSADSERRHSTGLSSSHIGHVAGGIRRTAAPRAVTCRRVSGRPPVALILPFCQPVILSRCHGRRLSCCHAVGVWSGAVRHVLQLCTFLPVCALVRYILCFDSVLLSGLVTFPLVRSFYRP